MKKHALPLAFLAALTILAPCATADTWTRVQCPLIDGNIQDRFEQTEVLADFQGKLGTLKVNKGSQQAKATLTLDSEPLSRPAPRVDYQFEQRSGIQYVEIAVDYPLAKPVPGSYIGIYYRQNQKGENSVPLRIRVIDQSGETHQFDLETGAISEEIDTDIQGPRLAVTSLNTRHKQTWGGDGNKKLDYPCKIYSIIADRPKNSYIRRGSLWIEKIAAMKQRPESKELVIELMDAPFGNVYAPGEAIKLKVSGKPSDTVTVDAVDFWGKAVPKSSSSGQLDFGQSAAGSQTTLTLQPKQTGYYACKIQLHRDGKVIEKRRLAFAVLPKPDPAKKNPVVGFCAHFRNHSYPANVMDLMQRYGFTEFRDEISWGDVETKENEHALPDYGKKFLHQANQLGLNPLLICDYGNRFYEKAGFPTKAKSVEAYAKYCAVLAKMIAEDPNAKIDSLEIWNEWTGGCGMNGQPRTNTPEAYAKLLKAAYKAIKAVDPSITVVGLGGEHSAHHFEHVREMLIAGAAEAADAFSVHPYRYPRTPEESHLYYEVLNVANVIEENGGNPRLWITEIGWPTYLGSRGVDETTQANYFVRTLALLQATGHVDKVHWYDFKNDGLDRKYNECNFGVVHHQKLHCQPKPAVVAATVFARETAGGACLGVQRLGSLWAVSYRMPDGPQKQLLWSTGKPVSLGEAVSLLGLDLQNGGKQPQVKNLMGNPLNAATDIEINESATYLSL